ncbi:hypothetical protein [Salinicoccus kekensis]|uniref:Uncharacterized protein n=1 Tax=Salinicoccus kekensis TaxID=714307 RepID=A0A285UTF3_9STAP|nr:hypothetical protein [Salinicoccus kekensis]SOC45120.1 hypothetical protein SAMN05878391_2618 [Salinicoccus kekensis]
MEQLDVLIQDNKVTIFDNDRFNEPLIEIDHEVMLITDYIFHFHSYKDKQVKIKSHLNDDWFSVDINRHIQRLRDNEIHDLEADTIEMRIKLKPLEILDEIIMGLNERYEKKVIGTLLNVLCDYSTYIDFLIEEKIADYTQQKELLFIEKEEGSKNISYHRLKLDKNQLKRSNNELIDILWFIDVVGINTNELKLLKSINTSFI